MRKSTIDLDALLERLEFTQENIIEATLEQTKLHHQAAMYRVQAYYAKTEAEMKLELRKASCALRIRRQEDEKKKGERKTETYIKELITKDTNYQIAVTRLNRATRKEMFAKLLLETFEMRMQCIRVITQVTGMERAVESAMKKKTEELDRAHKNMKGRYDND